MEYKIYKLQTPDGKVYIGQTTLSSAERWNSGKGYIKNPELYSEIQKHGWENIDKEILLKTENEEEAKRAEKFYITHFKSTNPLYGFNRNHGGRVKKWSEKAKNGIKGENNHQYGNPLTEEHKEKIRQTRRELGYEPVNKRKILCVELNRVFESTAAATRETGIHNFSIRRVCYGQRKTAGGYHWRYV